MATTNKHPTIIIVEDEKGIAETMGYLFEDLNWPFFCFSSGEDALGFLSKRGADMAIVDLRLPGMDGLEFIKKAHLMHSQMGFIVFTGRYDEEIIKEIETISRVSKKIFQKPLKNLEELVEEIRKMVYLIR